jgi:hypothetical protein
MQTMDQLENQALKELQNVTWMKGIAMFLGNTLTIATFILLGVVAIGPLDFHLFEATPKW